MKQKVKITTIISSGKDIILVRRSNTDLFELPQGVMSIGEQPEQFVSRLLLELFNTEPLSIKLCDVLSYVGAPNDRNRQNSEIFILYKVKISHSSNLKISRYNTKYNDLKYINLSEYVSQTNVSESSNFIMNVLSQDIDRSSIDSLDIGEVNSTQNEYILYTDGGSRGNPGKSAAAFALFRGNDQLSSGGEFLGITTNSQAEYQGLRVGLEAALGLGITRLVVKMDNLMVVNQMNGLYRVKNRELWPIYTKIKDLVGKFDYIKIEHVKREYNVAADKEVNRILDEAKSRSS